jgi:glycosyltransferase involved in cell wall biosynthesis
MRIAEYTRPAYSRTTQKDRVFRLSGNRLFRGDIREPMRTYPRRLPISLVIPAYNSEHFIRAALESASGGSCVPAEIIVVDDASADRTGDVAAEFGARVVRLPFNAGPGAARNAGVIIARQPWIAFLDADDTWVDGKLAAQWQALQHWPDAGICFTDYDVRAAYGAPYACEMAHDAGYLLAEPSDRTGSAARFERGALAKPLIRSMFIRQSSVLVYRALFIESGGYDERLRLSEDYDLFLRLAELAPAVAIERSLVVYHRRDSSLSLDPLAEIVAIDRMWATILCRPARYPAGIVEHIAHSRPATLRKGARVAIRLGRFAEAISFARQAATGRLSLRALALLALSLSFNNVAGHRCFLATRSLWRSRFEWPRRLRRLRRLPSHAAVKQPYVIGRH